MANEITFVASITTVEDLQKVVYTFKEASGYAKGVIETLKKQKAFTENSDVAASKAIPLMPIEDVIEILNSVISYGDSIELGISLIEKQVEDNNK